MGTLNGVAAVVTGGGSGLGREICIALAKKGAKLLVVDIAFESAEKTVKLAMTEGALAAKAYACDVRVSKEWEKLEAEATQFLGDVDFLVNNAGVVTAGPFVGSLLEDWKWIMETNLWGVVYGCHFFLPKMRSRGKGKILNIASAAGLLSPPEMAAYNVTKAGVIALSESLNAECQETGVRVTVACPMFFTSSLIAHSRIREPETRILAKHLVESSSHTAAKVAKACLNAVEREQNSIVPSWPGKVMWTFKRLMPTTYASMAPKVSKRWMNGFLKNPN